MAKTTADLLQGSLDLLILKALTLGPLHGWGVSKRIRQISREVFEVNQGSLYPALHRLEDRGYVTSEWRTSEEGRRAKFYRLTPLGRKQFADEQERWKLFAAVLLPLQDRMRRVAFSIISQKRAGKNLVANSGRNMAWKEMVVFLIAGPTSTLVAHWEK